MRISDWSSDVGSSDLDDGLDLGNVCHGAFLFAATLRQRAGAVKLIRVMPDRSYQSKGGSAMDRAHPSAAAATGSSGARSPTIRPMRLTGVSIASGWRSEEHTSELQSLMRISSAVFCL